MDGFLRVDHHSSSLPRSSTNAYLADEVASICPLITPSPPTNDLINALPEPIDPDYEIGEQLAEKLQKVTGKDKGDGDSASSSSSAEPACTQLLNHRNNMYHHITKNEETAGQETMGKTQPMQLTFRNPPEDYFFMSWNWPVIRKVSMWVFLSGLMAMVGLVIAMIWNLPKTCNPPTQWYQGYVFYEIFPASFYSSSHGMEGDLKGISMKSDYIMQLGIRAVRLNSIFNTPHYPIDFENVTSLIEIAPILGTIGDFKSMVKHLKSRNVSVVLDLPIYPYVKQLSAKRETLIANVLKNESNSLPSVEFLRSGDEYDVIEDSLMFWISHGVDGFYIKGLEKYVDDPNFAQSLRRWKKLLGPNRIIIVNENILELIPTNLVNILLNNVDLIDVKLTIENGVMQVSKQISTIQNGTLFTRAGMPWIHWCLGNVHSKRLADVLPFGNATLGATLLQMMLPGTPSIFYGDEIGLRQIYDPNNERHDQQHLHHLTMMQWLNHKSKAIPWNYGDFNPASTSFNQLELISKMSSLRSESPSIYMNSVNKAGENKANAEVKYSQKDFLVIQRWYPRRKSYVVASNLGYEKISVDLSTLLYTGQVVVGPRVDSRPEMISFKEVTLWPGESVIIVLD